MDIISIPVVEACIAVNTAVLVVLVAWAIVTMRSQERQYKELMNILNEKGGKTRCTTSNQ